MDSMATPVWQISQHSVTRQSLALHNPHHHYLGQPIPSSKARHSNLQLLLELPIRKAPPPSSRRLLAARPGADHVQARAHAGAISPRPPCPSPGRHHPNPPARPEGLLSTQRQRLGAQPRLQRRGLLSPATSRMTMTSRTTARTVCARGPMTTAG